MDINVLVKVTDQVSVFQYSNSSEHKDTSLVLRSPVDESNVIGFHNNMLTMLRINGPSTPVFSALYSQTNVNLFGLQVEKTNNKPNLNHVQRKRLLTDRSLIFPSNACLQGSHGKRNYSNQALLQESQTKKQFSADFIHSSSLFKIRPSRWSFCSKVVSCC